MAENEEVMAEQADVEVPLEGKMAEFVEWIGGITVLELSQLVKALEQRLGVSAAPMAMAVAGGGGGGPAPEAVEQTEFDVILEAAGDQRIGVIKEVRAITGLGLKESKDLVEGVPSAVKQGIPKAEAEEIAKKLEAAGAKVKIK